MVVYLLPAAPANMKVNHYCKYDILLSVACKVNCTIQDQDWLWGCVCQGTSHLWCHVVARMQDVLPLMGGESLKLFGDWYLHSISKQGPFACVSYAQGMKKTSCPASACARPSATNSSHPTQIIGSCWLNIQLTSYAKHRLLPSTYSQMEVPTNEVLCWGHQICNMEALSPFGIDFALP